jgi:hypothetical protein
MNFAFANRHHELPTADNDNNAFSILALLFTLHYNKLKFRPWSLHHFLLKEL